MDWEVIPHNTAAVENLVFPKMCPRCLNREDLTSYKVEYQTPMEKTKKRWRYRFAGNAGGKRGKSIENSCLSFFLVWLPVGWGILAALTVTGYLWPLIELFGFPWGLFIPGVLGITPLYGLYFLVQSFVSPVGLWPVIFDEQFFQETKGFKLKFENEVYTRKFTLQNWKHLRSVANWNVTPPTKLMVLGTVVDETLKQFILHQNSTGV